VAFLLPIETKRIFRVRLYMFYFVIAFFIGSLKIEGTDASNRIKKLEKAIFS
jgi:hypothetical protein